MPIMLSDGSLYGTLCGIDPDVHEFSPGDTELLQLLARILAFQIDRDAWADSEARMRQAAEVARGRADAIIDAASDAMLFASADGVVQRVNRPFQRLFPELAQPGTALDTIVARLAERWVDPAPFREFVARATADPATATSLLVEDVDERAFLLTVTPVQADDGEAPGRLCSLRDVTLEQRASQLKTQVLHEVAHELRTPLTAIRGHLDLLLDPSLQPLGPDLTARSLGAASQSAGRMQALINDMLDLGRIESGRVDFERYPLDLSRIAEGAVGELRQAIEASGQRLEMSFVANAVVLGDAPRLTQVVVNLLSNAHKYTPEGGALSVATLLGLGQVHLVVRDTGIGMSSDDLAQLFTRFFRSQDPAVRGKTGTGLGMVLTRALVEAHGGTIGVASQLGQGTTVTVSLPVAASTAA